MSAPRDQKAQADQEDRARRETHLLIRYLETAMREAVRQEDSSEAASDFKYFLDDNFGPGGKMIIDHPLDKLKAIDAYLADNKKQIAAAQDKGLNEILELFSKKESDALNRIGVKAEAKKQQAKEAEQQKFLDSIVKQESRVEDLSAQIKNQQPQSAEEKTWLSSMQSRLEECGRISSYSDWHARKEGMLVTLEREVQIYLQLKEQAAKSEDPAAELVKLMKGDKEKDKKEQKSDQVTLAGNRSRFMQGQPSQQAAPKAGNTPQADQQQSASINRKGSRS